MNYPYGARIFNISIRVSPEIASDLGILFGKCFFIKMITARSNNFSNFSFAIFGLVPNTL